MIAATLLVISLLMKYRAKDIDINFNYQLPPRYPMTLAVSIWQLRFRISKPISREVDIRIPLQQD